MFFSNRENNSDIPITAHQFIERKIENDNLILITATEKISRKWNKLLMRFSKKAYHKTDIFSIRNYVNNICKEYFGKEIIDEIIENELIINSLEYERKNIDYNTTSQIASIIRGLREDGIRSSNLQDDLIEKMSQDGFDSRKLEGLFNQMYNFELELKNKNLIDYPLAIEEITKLLENQRIISNKKFIFKNFTNFNAPDINFIEALSNANNHIIITTKLDKNAGPFLGNENFFVQDLYDIDFSLFENDLTKVDISLFNEKNSFAESTKKVFERNNKETVISNYINIQEEVYGITKLVKYLLCKDKYKPSEICIVSRDVGAYSLLLREFLVDNDIPANITDRFKLSQSPIAITVLDILETALSNYKITNLAKVLSSACIDTGIENASHFLYIADKYRLVGGIPDKGISTFVTQLQSRLNILRNNGALHNNDLNLIDEAIQKFTNLEKLFGKIDINKLYSPKEFEVLIKRIVQDFSFESKILELHDYIKNENIEYNEKVYISEKIEKDGRALYKLFEIVSKLKTILDSDTKFELEYLVRKLKGIISITKYQIREKKSYGVDVTSIEQTRGLDYKIKILAGAIEGMMPLGFGTDKLVGKVMRESERRHHFAEYIQFHEFFNDVNAEKFYIFAHREDNSEIKLLSQYITPILNLDNIVYSEEINQFDWQNTIINKRELIFNSPNVTTEEQAKIFDKYEKSDDLQINIEKDTSMYIDKSNGKCYSITELNNFWFKKYSYFYEKVLNLQHYENVDIYLSALELGNLIHSTVESVMTIYKSKYPESIAEVIMLKDGSKLEFFEIDKKHEKDLKDLFAKTVKEKLDIYAVNRLFYKLDEFYLIGNDNYEGVLLQWFGGLLSRHFESNYYIAALEYKFVCKESNHTISSPKFTGKIDRFDISKDKTSIRIIDYKSKYSKKLRETEQRQQLSLYGSVITKILIDNEINVEIDELVFDTFKYGFDEKDDQSYVSYNNDKGKLNENIQTDISGIEMIINNYDNLVFSNNKDSINTYDSFELKLLKKS